MTSLSRAMELEISGLIDPHEGLLSPNRFPTSRAVVPPKIWLEGDCLRWSWSDPDDDDAHGEEVDPKGALDAFLTVQDGDGALAFARRYGVLGICEHGYPATHNPTPVDVTTGKTTWCYPVGYPKSAEPLTRWFHYARQARALIRIAAALHESKPGATDNWRDVYEDVIEQDNVAALCDGLSLHVSMSRLYMAHMVREWLEWGNVRPTVNWHMDELKPSFSLAGGTFGLLAIQLMLAVSQSQNISVCSGCGRPYVRTGRRPQAGRRNYCPECQQRKIPIQDAKSAQRARKGEVAAMATKTRKVTK